MDRDALLAEADTLERTAARLRAMANAAPGAPKRGPSASEEEWHPCFSDIDLHDGSWFTIDQAAYYARCSVTTIRRHKRRTGVQIGGTWWIKRDRLFTHMRNA